MNIPGFHAEASLDASMRSYDAKAQHGGSAEAEVSMQQFGAASIGGRFQQTIKCCRFEPLLGRFVCTTRTVPIFYQCRCEFGFPVCRPPVSFPG